MVAETSLMQLVNTVAADLNLPTRVSPPYSHQSQGKVKRFHRNLLSNFTQQGYNGAVTSKSNLKIEPHMLPPVTSLGTSTQHLHPQQLPRTLFREDIAFRELPLQLPLQHRWFWRMCSRRCSQHPNAKATSEKSKSKASRHLAWA